MQQKIWAEFIGTAMLLISVVGSGIMAEALSGGNTGVALLANAIATGCMLYVLITTLGPVSGAHFNPAVTLAFTLRGECKPQQAVLFVCAQVAGGILGVWAAHGMFDLPILQLSTTERSGSAQWFAEVLATLGLLFAIFGGIAKAPGQVAALVAIYITGAYWFTASTSFANPAVTIARSLTDTFAGILPTHAPGFIAMQLIGAVIGAYTLPRLFAND
ncbi:MIP family channel protein [Actibacterium mucosum KCTC 23349]|uniref:MIP family channel protein n=1 Tax=Actibacterium mucosum KCTC 23349 TaxID=1454373 RepID=A0A037ZPP7_9RHOB|nr:MIP/aquaporin family protein [Actibacterium mucosum]KAJ56806.1 MIP family channel protein [Actibacterium mucosum KCTC 23349]